MPLRRRICDFTFSPLKKQDPPITTQTETSMAEAASTQKRPLLPNYRLRRPSAFNNISLVANPTRENRCITRSYANNPLTASSSQPTRPVAIVAI
jgi:hypothetical protein